MTTNALFYKVLSWLMAALVAVTAVAGAITVAEMGLLADMAVFALLFAAIVLTVIWTVRRGLERPSKTALLRHYALLVGIAFGIGVAFQNPGAYIVSAIALIGASLVLIMIRPSSDAGTLTDG